MSVGQWEEEEQKQEVACQGEEGLKLGQLAQGQVQQGQPLQPVLGEGEQEVELA